MAEMRLRILGLLAPVAVSGGDVQLAVRAEVDARAEAARRRALPAAALDLTRHRRAVPVLGNEDVRDVRERRAAVPTRATHGQRQKVIVVGIGLGVGEVDQPIALELRM
jgi:hypothetical protein